MWKQILKRKEWFTRFSMAHLKKNKLKNKRNRMTLKMKKYLLLKMKRKNTDK